MGSSHRAAIERVARDRLGYDSLRPGQAEAVEAILDRRDTVVVLPTGSGKSAIYQLAAHLLDGPTVVVSPLIALHQDQLRAITARLPGAAVVANSTQGTGAREEALTGLAAGHIEFLFLAPEQFANPETLARVRAARPSLLVIDEAHCISAWGHDFRPDYLRLGDVADELGHPAVLALTATASPPVREEIIEQLHMRDPIVVVRGFDRPNIRLSVETFHDHEDKHAQVVTRVLLATPPGIVYAATRKTAEALAAELSTGGVRAAVYHGGLRSKQRRQVQEAFMADEVDVVVATIAFGMGIDKPNVRFVYHYDASDSLDSYYQEIGRAGRDGLPADATLFFRTEDLGLRQFFAGGGRVGSDPLTTLVQAIDAVVGPVAPEVLGHVSKLSPSKLETALRRLAKTGAVELLPNGDVAASPGADLAGAAAAALRAEDAFHRTEQSRVEMMRAYAETRGCRRRFLLGYFGEHLDGTCDNCDTCEAGLVHDVDALAGGGSFLLPGTEVVHGAWGRGTVVRTDDDVVVVLFADVGYKTLALDVVEGRGLLQPL